MRLLPPCLFALLAPLLFTAHAAGLVVSEDGQEVRDPGARLAWARCLEGQAWTAGHCTGTPKLLRLAEARARAGARARETGQRWRLPRVPELQHLVRHGGEGLDPVLFPDTPAYWHWSATPSLVQQSANPYNYGNVMRQQAGQGQSDSPHIHGWAVHLGAGEARDDVPRLSRLAVRLVRDLR